MKLMLAYHPRSIMGDHPDRNVACESRFAEKEHRHNWRSVQSAKAVTIAISPRETLRSRKRYAWDPDTSGYATSTRRAAPSRRSGFSKNVESREGRDTYTPDVFRGSVMEVRAMARRIIDEAPKGNYVRVIENWRQLEDASIQFDIRTLLRCPE